MDLNQSTDYRQILAAVLADRCERNVRYSQRAFARDLQIVPHRLSQILRGKQGLSRDRAAKIAEKIGLKGAEVRRFCDLVDSQHARSKTRRAMAVRRIQEGQASSAVANTEPQNLRDLSLDKFHLIADWYHLAILELAKLPQFSSEPRWIARCLGIQEAEVRVAIDRLAVLGLVQIDATGEMRFSKADNAVPGGVSSEAVRAFHRRLIERALGALSTQSLEDREFNTSIIAIPRAKIGLLQKRVRAFWTSVFEEFGQLSDEADDLYCLGIQAFHLTDRAVLEEGGKRSSKSQLRRSPLH